MASGDSGLHSLCIYFEQHKKCGICRCSYHQVQVKVMGLRPRVSKHKYTFVLVSADMPSSKKVSLCFLDFSLFTSLKIPNLTACRLLRICKIDIREKL